MAEIDVTCPACGDRAHAPADAAGKNADCPNCGKSFRIPDSGPAAMPQANVKPPPAVAPRATSANNKTEVVITDIRMPFGSMVVFMLKWTVAAIPAAIIIATLGFIVSVVFMGGCAALLMGHK